MGFKGIAAWLMDGLTTMSRPQLVDGCFMGQTNKNQQLGVPLGKRQRWVRQLPLRHQMNGGTQETGLPPTHLRNIALRHEWQAKHPTNKLFHGEKFIDPLGVLGHFCRRRNLLSPRW